VGVCCSMSVVWLWLLWLHHSLSQSLTSQQCSGTTPVLYQGSCVDPLQPGLCGRGERVYLAEGGGAGYCDCADMHARVDGSPGCYQLETRGPCPAHQYLHLGEEVAVCADNPCGNSSQALPRPDSSFSCAFLSSSPCPHVCLSVQAAAVKASR